jgi:hypothetical protein
VRRIVIDIKAQGVVITPTVIMNEADLQGVWHANTGFGLNSIILDSNNNLQKLVTTTGTGKSGPLPPTWSTVPNGLTIDGGLTWQLTGPGIVVLPSFNPVGRTRVEYNVALTGETITLELTGSVNNGPIELFHVEFLPSVGGGMQGR